MYYTKFPDEIMRACLRGIREFREQHNGRNPSWLYFTPEIASAIEGSPPDTLGRDIGEVVQRSGARSITHAKLKGIDLMIYWGSREFAVSDQKPSDMDAVEV